MELAVDSNIIKLRSSSSPGERAISASPVEQQQQQGQQQRPSPVTQDEIEECTNQYFQKMYTSEDVQGG
jgi:2,4-dienoyl-CoA reductase-like NADH-dependent reductase (Old Yellow Enzyme family)